MAKKHGYAAFAPEDIEDAKRGQPDIDLTEYAATRGLTAMGSVQVGAFRGVLPAFPDYIFNVVRGVLPGGAFGLLEHELQEIPTHSSRGIMAGGAFYGTRYTARGPKGLLNKVLPFEISVDEPNEPFAASAVWVPVTAAVVRVPEAALLPRMAVGRKDRHGRGTPTSTTRACPASGSSATRRRRRCGPPCSARPPALRSGSCRTPTWRWS